MPSAVRLREDFQPRSLARSTFNAILYPAARSVSSEMKRSRRGEPLPLPDSKPTLGKPDGRIAFL